MSDEACPNPAWTPTCSSPSRRSGLMYRMRFFRAISLRLGILPHAGRIAKLESGGKPVGRHHEESRLGGPSWCCRARQREHRRRTDGEQLPEISYTNKQITDLTNNVSKTAMPTTAAATLFTCL